MQNWTVNNSSPNSLPSVETLQADSNSNLSAMLSGVCNYEIDDDFFNFSPEKQERSASFGGSTQYSQQFMHRQYGFNGRFESSLATLESNSGRILSPTHITVADFNSSIDLPLPTPPSSSPPFPFFSSSSSPSATSCAAYPPEITDYQYQPLHHNQYPHFEELKMMHQNHLRDEMCDGTATSSTSSVGRLGADAFVGCVGVTTNQEEMMMGEEMGPLARDRCNTWPMRRPQLEPGAQTSPLIHEQIPEEDDLFGSSEQIGRLGGSSNGSNAMLHSPDVNLAAFSPGMSSPGLNNSTLSPSHGSPESGNSKKSTTRRNAWGNLSYADLITQAIIQSPEKRLTLAQVYEWMVQNVPYFRDKGDSNSSAGWKVRPFSILISFLFLYFENGTKRLSS